MWVQEETENTYEIWSCNIRLEMYQTSMFVSKQHVHSMLISVSQHDVFSCIRLLCFDIQIESAGIHYDCTHLFQELSNIRLWLPKIVPRQDKPIFVCKCRKTKPHWLKMLNRDKVMILFTQPEEKCKNLRPNKQIFVISICKIIWFGCILNYRLTVYLQMYLPKVSFPPSCHASLSLTAAVCL